MLRVLWPGKTRDRLLAELIAMYEERIRHYAPLRLEEVAASRGQRPGEAATMEGRKLLARVPAGALLVALDPGGKEMASEAFAGWLDGRLCTGPGSIAFVIGGHDGLSAAVQTRAGLALSLSRMTFTHEMARVLLLEQLYRAFTILRGERYHH